MKKISANEAQKLLKQGLFPKCEVSRDVFKTVKSEQDIENLLNLSSLQKCQFYGYDEKEIEEFKVPDNCLSISTNEATDMVADGKTVFARIIGENEQSFSNLKSFSRFLNRCRINGENLLLYWHE